MSTGLPITAVGAGSKPRTILLTLAGGTQVLASMLGQRRYREPRS